MQQNLNHARLKGTVLGTSEVNFAKQTTWCVLVPENVNEHNYSSLKCFRHGCKNES